MDFNERMLSNKGIGWGVNVCWFLAPISTHAMLELLLWGPEVTYFSDPFAIRVSDLVWVLTFRCTRPHFLSQKWERCHFSSLTVVPVDRLQEMSICCVCCFYSLGGQQSIAVWTSWEVGRGFFQFLNIWVASTSCFLEHSFRGITETLKCLLSSLKFFRLSINVSHMRRKICLHICWAKEKTTEDNICWLPNLFSPSYLGMP